MSGHDFVDMVNYITDHKFRQLTKQVNEVSARLDALTKLMGGIHEQLSRQRCRRTCMVCVSGCKETPV